ncbi:MAG: IS256 family transposase, partial [Mycoplasma sp.]
MTQAEKKLQKIAEKEKLAKVQEMMDLLGIKDLKDLEKSYKQMTNAIFNRALEGEMDEHMGYDKWDQQSRNKTNNYRNGYSKKTVTSSLGDMEINVPRDKKSEFEPKIIKKHQTDISALEDKVFSMYSLNMSTRDITQCIKEIYGIEISASFISKVTNRVIPEIRAWQQRKLEKSYPILFIDGIRFKVREETWYTEKSVYIVIGVNLDGKKDVLGFWISESESSKYWLSIFNDIKTRGVEEINLVCSDNLKGISEAIKAAFPRALIQKCVVHQIRNSCKFVNYNDLTQFTKDMKKIYSSKNVVEAEKQLDNFEKNWGTKYPYAIKSWRKNFQELTTFFEFPPELKKMIYTTNIIENLNQKI